MIAFSRVIEDNIENDFDFRPVQGFDHVAKLIHRPQRIVSRAVGLMRREERDRSVTPVVNQARRAILGIELKYGKKFDS